MLAAPEELQRIGAAATERLYVSGDAVMRERDWGDELIVIVEGSVDVVRGEGPRSTTAIAGADSVRVLVIAGESLRAILRERPDAAMAMLGTLAERLVTQ